MWKIVTGGNSIFSDTEENCRRIFQGYCEWSIWKGEGSAAPLTAEVGPHPATWARPVELVDANGKTLLILDF